MNPRQEVIILLHAVQFLTRIPIQLDNRFSQAHLRSAVRYYPLVGAGVGALCAVVLWLATTVLPLSISVLLAIAFGLLLTGAFHEDGLADTFDGIGGGVDRTQALTIMKDSRVGTYGALALITMLVLKATVLIELGVVLACVALPVMHGLSRLSAVLVIASSHYVRDHGTGKPVADGVSLAELCIAGATVLILLGWLGFIVGLKAIFITLIVAFVGHAILRVIVERKLKGYTGDTLGAVQQSTEVAGYIGLLAAV